MTDLERRALLGDAEAQRECTERGTMLPCPFCGGRAVYHTTSTTSSGNIRGWQFGIKCTKCNIGTPKMAYRLNVDFMKDGSIRVCDDEREGALRTWNTRPAPPIGRCGECAHWHKGNCASSGPCAVEETDAEFYCPNFKLKGGEDDG